MFSSTTGGNSSHFPSIIAGVSHLQQQTNIYIFPRRGTPSPEETLLSYATNEALSNTCHAVTRAEIKALNPYYGENDAWHRDNGNSNNNLSCGAVSGCCFALTSLNCALRRKSPLAMQPPAIPSLASQRCCGFCTTLYRLCRKANENSSSQKRSRCKASRQSLHLLFTNSRPPQSVQAGRFPRVSYCWFPRWSIDKKANVWRRRRVAASRPPK